MIILCSLNFLLNDHLDEAFSPQNELNSGKLPAYTVDFLAFFKGDNGRKRTHTILSGDLLVFIGIYFEKSHL